MAVLQVLKGQTPGQQYPLDREESLLGRHPESDIVLDVQAVSRHHARIFRVDGDFFVEDLDSRNGTFVNGEKILGRRRLRENDRLKICNLLFTFHDGQTGRSYHDLEPGLKSSSIAMLVDDEPQKAQAAITSSLDLSSTRVGGRVTVNAEAKLKAWIEITQSLAAAVALEEVLPKLLAGLGKIFAQADRGFIVMRRETDGPLIPEAIWHRRSDEEDTIRISRTIVERAMKSKEAILSADAASDERFDASQSIADFRIRSMMCAPLISSEGEAMGVLQIDTLDQRSRFQQDDLDMLASVASQAAFAVENAQLHEMALRERAMERDLQLAHRVQQGLLPDRAPELAGYAFFNFYEPANQVGGDYYGYFPMPGGRLAIVVADVAGKGIPAALLMAKLSAEAGAALISTESVARALDQLNASFSRAAEDRFVTLVLAVIDPATHQVSLANAGHMPPYLRRRGGQVEEVGGAEAGYPLGIESDYHYQEYTMQLEPGDSLTVFTDGVSEAINADGELYGLARLKQQLAADAPNVELLARRVLLDAKHHLGAQSQTDDMCLLSFGRV